MPINNAVNDSSVNLTYEMNIVTVALRYRKAVVKAEASENRLCHSSGLLLSTSSTGFKCKVTNSTTRVTHLIKYYLNSDESTCRRGVTCR